MKKKPEMQVNPVDIYRILFEALQEITGKSGLQAIINMTSLPIEKADGTRISVDHLTPDNWQNLAQTLESLYGQRGAYGIAVRTGQVFFRDFFRSFGLNTGMMDRHYRMLPKPKRIQRGLEILADSLSLYIPDLQVDVIQDSENWYWRFKNMGLFSDSPGFAKILLKFIVGIIREFLSWTSGGKFYPVNEMNLAAEVNAGPIIIIQKRYID